MCAVAEPTLAFSWFCFSCFVDKNQGLTDTTPSKLPLEAIVSPECYPIALPYFLCSWWLTNISNAPANIHLVPISVTLNVTTIWGILALLHSMPCIHSTIHQHRRFLPHFPPGSMQCDFSPELVPLLFHAMRGVFQKKLENDPTDGPIRSHLCRRSHRLRPLHHSYWSLQGKLAASVVGDTPLKMSLNNSMGGKMDFTIKSGYNLLVCHTVVALRLFLGRGTFFGWRIFGYDSRLFCSSNKSYE